MAIAWIGQRRPPLSPLDGLAMKRLDLAAVERLAAEPLATLVAK